MRTVAEIDAEIEQVKRELEDVHGTEAEVYARIVGYYRSVRNWNKGKREEYGERKVFVPSKEETDERLAATEALEGSCALPVAGKLARGFVAQSATRCAIQANATAQDASSSEKGGVLARVELFARKMCPNCPPVKEYVEERFEGARVIDVDSAEGFARAQECAVLSTPTVIFYGDEGEEIARAHSLSELKAAEAELFSIANLSA